MTKDSLIDNIMVRFGYHLLDLERQVAVRKVYGRMKKAQLERLLQRSAGR